MKTRPPHGKRRAIWPSLSSFGEASFHPLSLSLSVSRLKLLLLLPSGVLQRRRSLRSPLPPSSSSSPAAGIMKVATSPARSHLSIPPSRPPSRCIVQLLSWERRDLLLAFEMIMPSRPRDTDGRTEKERQKEDSHCGRKNKLNEGTKRPAASRAMNMDEISSCHSYLETVAFLRQLLTFAYPYEFCFKREE